MKLIVGLGNPGSNYTRTRHNVGFSLLDELARELGANFAVNKRFKAEVAQTQRLGKKLILLKPMTYMNLSGQAVSKALNFYKLTANNTLVIYDDIDLPEGKVKLKEKGGHGGHNGVRSMLSELSSPDFSRLKVGVGRPETASPSEKNTQVTDWLLKPVNQTSYDGLIDSVFNEVLDRLDIFLKQ